MSNQPRINTYFKQVKHLSEIQPVETAECVTSTFYKNCLEEKEQCNNELCIDKKNELNVKREEVIQKIRKIEEAMRVCSTILSEKDKKIDILRKQANGNSMSLISCAAALPKVASQPISNTEGVEEEEATIFSEFSTDFSAEDLAVLRSIGSAKREDSTFVATSMKCLYKDDLSILEQKTLTGRSSKTDRIVYPVTPKKVEILSKMFDERINSITHDEIEKISRNKCLNKYIKDAIMNINKIAKTKETEKNACKQLQKETLIEKNH